MPSSTSTRLAPSSLWSEPENGTSVNLPKHFLREFRPMLKQSRGLRTKPSEGQPGGKLPGRNHSVDRLGTGKITGEGNARMDEQIGVTDSRSVMRRVSTTRTEVMRTNADPTQ